MAEPLKVGDRVTVWRLDDPQPRRAVVHERYTGRIGHAEMLFSYYASAPGTQVTGTIVFADEDRIWVRGWQGETVDLFRARAALERS